MTTPPATETAANEAPPAAEAEPVFGGVRALLYVAVQAALSEGFAEEEVFEHEKLSPEAWQRGDEAWAAALAESVDTDSKLFDNYDATCNAYKWAFHRVIEPLESDLDVWLSFSARLNASEDQDAFLETHGIDQNDTIRLQEIWAARLSNDPNLRAQMLDKMGREPGEIPALNVPPKVLPPPVNSQPIAVPPEELEEPEAKEPPRPPPPPLMAVLPVFPKKAPASGAPGGPSAPPLGAPAGMSGIPGPSLSVKPETAASAPPVEDFGFYVPPPERVTSRPAPAMPPPVVQPTVGPPAHVVANVAPPAFVSAKSESQRPDWQRIPPPQLSIHDYTSAVAEIQAFPGSESRVASKYGMTADGFAKERIAWDNQLAQMPALRPEYADRLGRAVSHWQALARRR